MKLSCNTSKTNLTLDGKPFFLLGDTCWSAFTHPTLEEWDEYLAYRQEQGFNAVQINVLPQRHAAAPAEWRHPFALNPDGSYDFHSLQPSYFERAKKLLAAMKRRGMIPMLVLLWGNYVPGTWQQRLDQGRGSVLDRPFSMVMPFDAMQRYVEYAVDCFKGYEPVWVISGDTDLNETETVRYYTQALRIAKKSAPACLTTLHLFPDAVLLPSLLDMPELDYYMFQPGHDIDRIGLNRELSRKFSTLPVKRPAMNSEACYEANSYFHGGFGRFTKRHVRFAFWQSVLNGACAGFTYGAAGIWLWQRPGAPCSLATPLFPGPGHRWFDQAHDWRTDLALPGGWDVAFGRWLIETFHAWELAPADGLVSPDVPQIAAAMNGQGTLVAYLPCATTLTLSKPLHGYRLQWFDLDTHRPLQAVYRGEGDKTVLELPRCTEDCLLIGCKE